MFAIVTVFIRTISESVTFSYIVLYERVKYATSRRYRGYGHGYGHGYGYGYTGSINYNWYEVTFFY